MQVLTREERMLRRRGIIIATAGVVSVTPDAVLVRWATQLGASTVAIIFFKMLSIFFFTMSWVMVSEGRTMYPLDRLVHRCRGGLHFMAGIMLIQALVDIFFPLAFLMTYAANVLLLYSLQPVWSALLGWMILRDRLPRRTLFALAGALVAITVMFIPAVMSGQSGGTSEILGNIIAIGLGFCMSAYVLVSRVASTKVPELPIAMASALGALLGAVVVAAYAMLTGTSVLRRVSPLFFVVMAIDGVCVGSIFIAFSIAPKYIPGRPSCSTALEPARRRPNWLAFPARVHSRSVLLAFAFGAHFILRSRLGLDHLQRTVREPQTSLPTANEQASPLHPLRRCNPPAHRGWPRVRRPACRGQVLEAPRHAILGQRSFHVGTT